MERLVGMFLEHREMGVPPELEAAWLHHRFTQIHPFQDGNGRVARALSSIVLIQAELFPTVIRLRDKAVYLRALERADEGNLGPFVNLISQRQLAAYRRACDVVLRFEPNSSTPEEAAARLADAMANRDEAREASYVQKVYQLLETVKAGVQETMARIQQTLLQAHPGAQVSGWPRIPPAESAQYRDALASGHDIFVADPVIAEQGSVGFANNLKLTLLAYVALHSIEETVQVAAFIDGADGKPQLLRDPISWVLSHDQDAELRSAKESAKDIVTALLDYVRKAL
jgi:hypothetical protein